MKTMTTVLLFTLALGHSTWAAQENRGLTYCSSAQAICQSDDQEVVACAFSNMTYVALRTTPEESSYRFTSKQVQSESGVYGAGLTFSGPEVTLHIETDLAPSTEGVPALLTAKSIGLNNKRLRCTFN